jgi:ABC-2 type transport system permease protein
MIKLIKIELKKIFSYKIFLVFTALYVILLPLIFTSVGKLSISVNAKEAAAKALYNFPNLWHNLTYYASFFNLLLYLLIIILVTNEFTFKTLRQNIIDGLSKLEIVGAKLLLILLISVFSTIFLILVGLGCGYYFSESMAQDIILEKSIFLFAYFLQTYAYMTIALFISIVIKRQGFSIILFLLFPLIEWIIGIFVGLVAPKEITNYLPWEAISNLIQNPAGSIVGMKIAEAPETLYITLTVVYIVVFSVLSWGVLEKTDN